MRVPLPTNKIVGLALLGTLLTAGVSAALAVPSLFDGADDSPDLPADAPAANAAYQPAVRYDDHDDDRYEHEEHDDDD